MTVYCRPAFLMSTLIVSAPVRGSPAPEHYVWQWTVFLDPGSLRRKNGNRLRQFEHSLIWGNKSQL